MVPRHIIDQCGKLSLRGLSVSKWVKTTGRASHNVDSTLLNDQVVSNLMSLAARPSGINFAISSSLVDSFGVLQLELPCMEVILGQNWNELP